MPSASPAARPFTSDIVWSEMPERTFVYVDGESHFIRSENAWRRLHGEEATLEAIRHVGQDGDRLVLVKIRAKVFWTRKMNPEADRTYYFTSVVGDNTALHQTKVDMRNFGLEPHVIQEQKSAARQRENLLATQGLIEKPKGVDIALAVRMLEDSLGLYEACHLYTSDIDFLPVIQAVRARGKKVFVHGYFDGLADQSPFLHECDGFDDLGEALRTQFEFVRPT